MHHDGSLEHEWSAAAARSQSDSDGNRETKAKPHWCFIGELQGLFIREAIVWKLTDSKHDENHRSESNHVDPVERVDPVDFGKSVMSSSSPQI